MLDTKFGDDPLNVDANPKKQVLLNASGGNSLRSIVFNA